MPRGWKWDPGPFHRKRWLEPLCKGGVPCLHPCLLLCWSEFCTRGGPRGLSTELAASMSWAAGGEGDGHPSWMTVPHVLTRVSRSL